MSAVALIYALTEPGKPWNIRYVGKTTQKSGQTVEQALCRRVYLHQWDTSRAGLGKIPHNHRTNWLQDLASQGLQPDYRLIDIGTEENWEALERFHIKSHLQAGFNLVNMSPGGGPPPSWAGKRHTPKTRAKISRGNRGKVRSPEVIAALSARTLGQPSTMKGRKHTTAALRKMSEAKLGNTHCAGRVLSEGTKKKIGDAHWSLSPSQREEVRLIYVKGGVSQAELGRRFGVHQTTIFYAIHEHDKKRKKR